MSETYFCYYVEFSEKTPPQIFFQTDQNLLRSDLDLLMPLPNRKKNWDALSKSSNSELKKMAFDVYENIKTTFLRFARKLKKITSSNQSKIELEKGKAIFEKLDAFKNYKFVDDLHPILDYFRLISEFSKIMAVLKDPDVHIALEYKTNRVIQYKDALENFIANLLTFWWIIGVAIDDEFDRRGLFVTRKEYAEDKEKIYENPLRKLWRQTAETAQPISSRTRSQGPSIQKD